MNPVLFLDVDTQRDFLEPTGGLPVPGAQGILLPLARLTEAIRAERVRGFATVDTHTVDDPEFAVFPPHCIRGRAGQAKVPETLVPGAVTVGERPLTAAGLAEALVAPQLLFEKHVLDGFTNPNLAMALSVIAPRQVVVYGVATEYCVQAAVLGLVQRGYHVVVADDAIKGVELGAAIDAWRAMAAAGAQLRSTQEILEDVRCNARR